MSPISLPAPCCAPSKPTLLCVLRPPCFVSPGPLPFTLFPSTSPVSPYLGKRSSLKLQQVEPSVYILFYLCLHPMQDFEESEKNLLLYPSLSPALLLDGGWGGVRMREGGRDRARTWVSVKTVCCLGK